MKKKIVGLLMAASMCVGIFGTATPILAANTSDVSFNFDVKALNFNTTTGKREKTNKTPVYVYVTSLADNSSVYVRALGVTSDTSQNLTENGTTGTIVSYVTCNLKTKTVSTFSNL